MINGAIFKRICDTLDMEATELDSAAAPGRTDLETSTEALLYVGIIREAVRSMRNVRQMATLEARISELWGALRDLNEAQAGFDEHTDSKLGRRVRAVLYPATDAIKEAKNATDAM